MVNYNQFLLDLAWRNAANTTQLNLRAIALPDLATQGQRNRPLDMDASDAD